LRNISVYEKGLKIEYCGKKKEQKFGFNHGLSRPTLTLAGLVKDWKQNFLFFKPVIRE
jgi:hypothetical protein